MERGPGGCCLAAARNGPCSIQRLLLLYYADRSGSTTIRSAADEAEEIFLRRQLYKRQHEVAVIASDFVWLHNPCFWHYDILVSLNVIAEAGFLDDPRCGDALDLLHSKRLLDSGFPAEASYYRWTNQPGAHGPLLVD